MASKSSRNRRAIAGERTRRPPAAGPAGAGGGTVSAPPASPAIPEVEPEQPAPEQPAPDQPAPDQAVTKADLADAPVTRLKAGAVAAAPSPALAPAPPEAAATPATTESLAVGAAATAAAPAGIVAPAHHPAGPGGGPALRAQPAAAGAAAEVTQEPEQDRAQVAPAPGVDADKPSAEDEAWAEDEEGADDEGWAASRRGRSAYPLVLMSVLVLGLVAACAATGVILRSRVAYANGRSAATAAARLSAPLLLSYDYRHLDADEQRAKTVMTPTYFTQSYAPTFDKGVKPNAVEPQAVVSSQVLNAAPLTANNNTVAVLLFVDTLVQRKDLPTQRLDRSRLRLVMKSVNGGWLIDDAQAQ